MSLPRWSAARVRPDESPELTTSRGFESLQTVLSAYATLIESHSTTLQTLVAKFKKLAYPVLQGFYIVTGTNSRLEDVVLVAGTKVVANTSVTSQTRFFFDRQNTGGTLGHLSVVPNAGVGYTLNSSSATETSTVAVMMVERI